MIGTIRKHSGWLWILIAGLTIISFVVFMGKGPGLGGGGRSGGYGTIYGKEVTPEAFTLAQREYLIYFWRNNGEWPDRSPGFKREDLEKGIYIRLLLIRKAENLGIHVSDDMVRTVAVEFLRSLGRNDQPVPMDQFVSRILLPEGITPDDFQRFLRNDLAIQQMIQTMGLAGALVTPQEASQYYDHEQQEVSAQAVFFSASNYLSQVTVTPSAVTDFYQKNMATYREPDRMQVNYVAFESSNFLAQAKAEWAKTNLEENVDAAYRQYGATEFADAKTPEEAKAKIRELLIHNRALTDAGQEAKQFATALFAMDPAKPENLAALAKKNKLAVHITAPFNVAIGPEEISVPPAFTKAAFKLSADEPLAGPIVGADAAYVLALASRLPSSIPSLDQIRSRVTKDFQNHEATELAQRAGTNFYVTATVQMALKKTFAQTAVAAGQTPQFLTAFSLSSQDVPEAGDRAEIGQLKQAAFTTAPGHIANFVATEDGGFVLYVQSLLPVDQQKKMAELPQFTAQIRRGRENEAFNYWLQAEANRELRNTPIFPGLMGGKSRQP